MAYHEQHERKCPTCGERISASAPKCFNCGEFVTDDDDEDDGDVHESSGPGTGVRGVLSIVAVLGCLLLLVYLLSRAL